MPYQVPSPIQPLVLVVDDDHAIVRLLTTVLTAQDMRVIAAPSGDQAVALVERCRPDVAMVDVVMPGMSGHELMRHLTHRWGIPVILLSDHDRPQDRIHGLEMGADDFISKPFDPGEASARVRAVLRRASRPSPSRVIRAGDVTIDLLRRRATRNGIEVVLTRTEWLLLEHLSANAGRVLFTNELLAKVWGPEYRDELHYLRVWVSRLRQKLGDSSKSPRIIRTLPGIGYMFLPGEAVAEPAATVA